MSTFVLMYFFVLLYFFVRKWLRAVKIYLHAKFRASSSKIERVMLNFIFCSAAPTPPQPVTNLPVELCASRQLTIHCALKHEKRWTKIYPKLLSTKLTSISIRFDWYIPLNSKNWDFQDISF